MRQVEGNAVFCVAARIVERVDQRERVAAVAVEDEREDLVAAIGRAAIGPGRERLRGAAVRRRDGDVVDLLAVRLHVEVVRAGRNREPEAVGRAAGGLRRAVGAERHEVRNRAADHRRGGARAVVVAVAVEIARAGRRVGEGAFVDAARDVGRPREHRHVVGHGDLEVARERDAVAVEVDRLDQVRQVEGRRVLLPAARVVERLEQLEHPRAVAVEREREHGRAALARVGGERLRVAVEPDAGDRERDVVDLDPVRLDAEVERAAARDRELEAVGDRRDGA